jgi:thiamine pyrophosphate-dependent acetolactate synthase large subunit-like protein
VNGGQACVEVLRHAGVECVFGLLGGSMLELYDGLAQQDQIRYVGARDERAAGHMADAFARLSKSPGIVLGAQAGPGVANLVTAVAEAHLAYSPLVVIAGAISRVDQGKDTFQEIDQVALFAPICKRSSMVTSGARLTDSLFEAMHLAASGRPGPVVLHVPRDLFLEDVPEPSPRKLYLARPGQPTNSDIEAILRELRAATKPVIFAGGGFKNGRDGALVELAELLNVPVVCSTGHADLLPSQHVLYAGQTGPRGNSVAAGVTREADLILAFGARLAFNSTFLNHDYINPSARIVQVDVESSAVGRYYPVEVGTQAGAAETALALSEAAAGTLDVRRWAAWTQRFKEERIRLDEARAEEGNIDTVPLAPTRVLAEVRDSLPTNAIVTLDTGNVCLQAADRLTFSQCPSLVAPLDFGLVGFGYAAAIGASAADRTRPVVCIMGDGGFGYTLTEITTAVAQQLPVIAVVLDNGAWGAEKAYQQTYFEGRVFGADIHTPALDEVATLCGAKGYRVAGPGETAAALRDALDSEGPAVIHVHVDPTAIKPLRKDLFKKENIKTN